MDDTTAFFAPRSEQGTLYGNATKHLPEPREELVVEKIDMSTKRACANCGDLFNRMHLGRWRGDLWFCSMSCKRSHTSRKRRI
jgi:hypothetical protein